MPYYERWVKPSKPSIGRNLLILFVFLSLIKGLLFAAIIPAWQGPDEPVQFGYVQYLVERKTFPIMGKAFLPPSIIASLNRVDFWRYRGWETDFAGPPPDPLTKKDILYSAMHPPLYYSMCIPFYLVARSGGILAQLFSVRLFNVILGGLVVLLAFKITQIIFPGDYFMWIGATSLVLLHPQLSFTMAVTNNDNLTILLLSLLLYILILAFKNSLTTKRSVVVGLILGLGMLSKGFFLAAVPLIGFCYLLILLRRDLNILTILSFFKYLCLTYFSGFLVCGWWYLRNLQIYGSLNPIIKYERPITSLSVLLFKTQFLRDLFVSFWGNFGWHCFKLPHSIYRILFISCALSAVGILLHFLKIASRRIKPPAHSLQSLILLLACIFGFLAILVWYEFKIATVQGRYFFPSIIPFCVLLVLGIKNLIPSPLRKLGLLAFLSGATYLNIFSLYFIILFYYHNLAGL